MDITNTYLPGHLSLQEFTRQTDHFIAIDPVREHMHNQLLCAIHTNVFRDAPDANVAAWVSANDKPNVGVTKPVSGDAEEQRLKTEVMQLPPRVRHRLKAIKDVRMTTEFHSSS